MAGMLPGWRSRRRRRLLVVATALSLLWLAAVGVLCVLGFRSAPLLWLPGVVMFIPSWTMLRIASHGHDHTLADYEQHMIERNTARSMGLTLTQALTFVPVAYLLVVGSFFPDADSFRTAYAGGAMAFATLLAGGCAPAMILAWTQAEPKSARREANTQLAIEGRDEGVETDPAEVGGTAKQSRTDGRDEWAEVAAVTEAASARAELGHVPADATTRRNEAAPATTEFDAVRAELEPVIRDGEALRADGAPAIREVEAARADGAPAIAESAAPVLDGTAGVRADAAERHVGAADGGARQEDVRTSTADIRAGYVDSRTGAVDVRGGDGDGDVQAGAVDVRAVDVRVGDVRAEARDARAEAVPER